MLRDGLLVDEAYSFNVLSTSRFDVWSCTKSFTGTAWGHLLEHGDVALDDPVYDYVPEGYPLTDPRKEAIEPRHLLSMTSDIPGEDHDLRGNPTATDDGPFEAALGKVPNRHGRWADDLAAAPGEVWDYSDPAFAHLSLAFCHAAGRELADYAAEHVFDPIGIENPDWDVQGGSGHVGPHSNPHTGVHVSARELARLGYLVLRRSRWDGEQALPEWIEQATQSSQALAPDYGLTWWVNTAGTCWQGLPTDTFAAKGTARTAVT